MISPRILKTWGVLVAAVFVVATTLFSILGTPRLLTGGQPVFGWVDPVVAGAAAAIASAPLTFVICAVMPGSNIGRRFDESKCPRCDYDLTGVDTDRCPECGSARPN